MDYGANFNLLRAAEQADVGRFAYIQVLKAQFFLTALALDMVGEARGERRLSAHFQDLTGATGDTPSREATP